MRTGWTTHDGMQLEYLDNAIESNTLMPVVFVPGMLSGADIMLDEMTLLGERRVVSLSRRGCGKSTFRDDASCALADYAGDIGALVNAAKLDSFHLIAFSTGVAFAVRYAADNPERIRSLLLVDYTPVAPAVKPAWADRVMKAVPDINSQMIQAIIRDSERVEMWHEIGSMTCPITVFYGEQSTYVDEDDIAKYRKYVPQVAIVKFDKAGHQVWEHDYDGFIAASNTHLANAEQTISEGADNGTSN